MNVQTLALATALLLVVGCQKADPLVGDWTTDFEIMGAKGTSEMSLKADGTFTGASSVSLGQGTLKTTDTGTWKVDAEGKLDLTLVDTKWTAVGADGKPMTQMQSLLDGQKKAVMDGFNAAAPSKPTWKGNDEFTFAMDGQTYVYTRKK